MTYVTTKLFRIQLIGQLLLVGIVLLFSLPPITQAVFCGILLCVVGIPHGSNDYLYRPNKSLLGMLIFLGIYLGVMMAYGILWWIMPLLSLILFFSISFHHFGQSNFENTSIWHLPSIGWGIWILALPVVLHENEATALFREMTSSSSKTAAIAFFQRPDLSILSSGKIALLVSLAGIYLASLFFSERKNLIAYVAQFILVSSWYLLTPLLFGFIVVFCLWHSLQSVQHQFNYFQQQQQVGLKQFIRAMFPFSFVALIVFGLYVYMRGFQISEAFILLSLITLPHVLVMHRLYSSNPH